MCITMLRDFFIFSYWGFIAQLEVKGESYEFSKVDLVLVITLIVLRSFFGLEN